MTCTLLTSSTGGGNLKLIPSFYQEIKDEHLSDETGKILHEQSSIALKTAQEKEEIGNYFEAAKNYWLADNLLYRIEPTTGYGTNTIHHTHNFLNEKKDIALEKGLNELGISAR